MTSAEHPHSGGLTSAALTRCQVDRAEWEAELLGGFASLLLPRNTETKDLGSASGVPFGVKTRGSGVDREIGKIYDT